MQPFDPITRRTMLSTSGIGFGAMALQALSRPAAAANAVSRGLAELPHHPPKAKRVIYLYMCGGPSHLETFDYKPHLDALNGQPMPDSFTKGQPIAQLQGKELKVQGHLAKFRQHGESGQWISDFLPYHAHIADDITVIRSMITDQINHDPAHTLMNTGTAISGRPSLGSWVTYGLGNEADDLPGYVVMTSFAGREPQPLSQRMWGNGFLPGKFQGVEFNASGDPVLYLGNPQGITTAHQRSLVDTIAALDRHRNSERFNADVDTRISQYEMAFKMQASVPDLMDISRESKETLDLYGATPGDGSFASNCLTARRLAERGVRFIQLFHRDWDHHGGLVKYMNMCCGATDRATWALMTDLKRRGLLDDTLIIWGGEFGRTPMFQDKGGPGRDHHIKGFSVWLAGGGIKPGLSYGATDELGYNAVENPVHVRDLHATILHQLGINHERFTVKYQGLDTKLTGVEPAHPVYDILQ
ncbi:DUF1501 domain-containing protein [Planctomicrobium sp. SH664]|uniref:DUF1501 domain-containing protein n=1 Tax=Planctomicrobium sp. SH664 TaxID=3448125 RepID=UPI003F5C2BC1